MVESVPTVPGEIGRFSTAIGTEPAIARRIASERYPAGSEDKHKRGTCPDRVLPPRRSPRKDAAHNGRECLARSSRLPGGCADGGRRGRGEGRHPARGTPVRGGPTGTATRGRLRSRVEEQVARRGRGAGTSVGRLRWVRIFRMTTESSPPGNIRPESPGCSGRVT